MSPQRQKGRKDKYIGGIDTIRFLRLDETSTDGEAQSTERKRATSLESVAVETAQL